MHIEEEIVGFQKNQGNVIISFQLRDVYNCNFSINFFIFIKNTSILLLWSIY